MNQFKSDIKIIGTGSYAPENVVTNEMLAAKLGTEASWIKKNLGIDERRIAADNQATSDLAYQAGLKAIENAKLSVDDIDLIIVATATPDRKAPSTACIVQEKLQAFNSFAFDVSAVCTGFLTAMSVASQFIHSGSCKNVLVIGADKFSSITDWNRRDAVFFGDGAGAAILTGGTTGAGFLSFNLYSDGRGKDAFTVPAGGSEQPLNVDNVKNGEHYFQMDGGDVFRTATKVLPEAINTVLKQANLSIEDIDLMVPHQPSIRILEETAKTIGLPFDKVMTNMDRYANTSGGTIPILLDELNKSGKLSKGMNIIFAAVGSGWIWGAAIFKWS